MTFLSKAYTGLLSALLSSCVQQNITPIEPTYPFKIQGYSIFLDDEPGYYDVIKMYGVKKMDKQYYCYFSKKTEDDDYLFIYDKDCDLNSDRVLVFSGDRIIVAADTKNLEDEVVGMLNSVLRNHTKTVVDTNKIIIF